jgi:hypothetical protein
VQSGLLIHLRKNQLVGILGCKPQVWSCAPLKRDLMVEDLICSMIMTHVRSTNKGKNQSRNCSYLCDASIPVMASNLSLVKTHPVSQKR